MMNIRNTSNFNGTPFVVGNICGEILSCQTELSFWGGVEPSTGEVIDRHHPLSGKLLQGKILVLPGGRGSCSGSGVILEMLVNGKGPDAILMSKPDDIITLGVLVAQELFDISIPVVMLSNDDFKHVISMPFVSICGGLVRTSHSPILEQKIPDSAQLNNIQKKTLSLSTYDQALLNGDKGEAAQIAMKIILQMANLVDATELIDVTQVHIDGCIYTGKASLQFAQKLRDLGGKVVVPTSLNAISVDYRRWKSQGVSSEFGEQASALADAYVQMGAQSTYTCAPYLLDSAPQKGEQIAWAESNAVVFANSVLGAHTMKYPDFLDACIALTGRAPKAGPHIENNRKATMHICVTGFSEIDDLFFPLLGYHVGKMAGNQIPVIDGIDHFKPDFDDLKSFGAAFATSSSAPMFHIIGVTPNAIQLSDVLSQSPGVTALELCPSALLESWYELNHAHEEKTDLVSLGNPHFSLSEFKKLAELCTGNNIDASVSMVITAGRTIVAQATKLGYIDSIEQFGAQIITDTCWCMIEEPIVPSNARVICTNSAKYAHYGPGMTGKRFKFVSLADCVQEAVAGNKTNSFPSWIK